VLGGDRTHNGRAVALRSNDGRRAVDYLQGVGRTCRHPWRAGSFQPPRERADGRATERGHPGLQLRPQPGLSLNGFRPQPAAWWTDTVRPGLGIFPELE